jgi:hypothetical protein
LNESILIPKSGLFGGMCSNHMGVGICFAYEDGCETSTYHCDQLVNSRVEMR